MASLSASIFALSTVALVFAAELGASTWVDADGAETSLVQVHISINDKEVERSPSLHSLTLPADIATELVDDDLEIGLSRIELSERNSTGHLHHMAKAARWVGWRHFTNVHPNGTLVDKQLVQDSSVNFFHSAPPREWVILVAVCFVLCLLDGLVLRRAPDSFRWHLAVIGIWIVVAGFYLWGVWARMGRRHGVEWISGYILEWMLSMDNLFIFHLVFQTYKTPQAQIHKAVFVGIIGAVVMRMVFFLVVSTLLHAFGWFRWPFGAMLVWSGIEAVRGEEDDDGDVKDTRLVRCLKWAFGSMIKDGYDTEGTSIIIWDRKNRRVQLSLLFVVIVIVEFSDIIFALDSVSAKVAQIPNQYIAFSSSVMAMYGLRAMFFIVQDLVEMFDLLKYGLGVILVFIGVELMFAHYIHMASGLECILIVGVFVVCIIASHIKSWLFPEEKEEGKEDGGDKSEEDGEKAKAGKEEEAAAKEAGEEEVPNPLKGLSERPEGEQVEHDAQNAWTVHEGTKTSHSDEEKEHPRNRSRSESDIKREHISKKDVA